MASSSHKFHSLLEQVRVLGEDEKEDRRDWLELGLGLGFSSSGDSRREHDESNPVLISSPTVLSSPSSTFHGLRHHQQIGVGVGLELGLGFGNKSCVRCLDVEPICNNHKELLLDLDQDQDYDDDDDDVPSWPVHMDSGSFLDWQMPKFNDSHDYSTRRRPHPGLWFTLLSCTNREGETLPQIPKAYIRVKDENVTVFMVKKYLVRKLGLSNEAEIDISCMGQSLLQTLTLKQVRDAVWLPRLIRSINTTNLILENSQQRSINNHLMPLHYGRRCLFD